jgi:hypothetical protein
MLRFRPDEVEAALVKRKINAVQYALKNGEFNRLVICSAWIKS